MSRRIPAEELDVIAHVLAEHPLADNVERLHEGNVARYRLKLSEFQGWKINRL